MAGENSQDFDRAKHERMTEQKQDAERGLEIGSREQQQHEQQGMLPQRKPGDHPGGSIGETSPNPSRSQQAQGSSGKKSTTQQVGGGAAPENAPEVGGEGPGEFKEQENRFPRQDEQGEPQRQPRGEEEDASGQSS